MRAAHAQIANRAANDRVSAADVAMELATWGTGLGVITFVLCPLLIPGIAVLALLCAPAPAAGASPVRVAAVAAGAGRATRRKESKGSRGLRTGAQPSLVKRR